MAPLNMCISNGVLKAHRSVEEAVRDAVVKHLQWSIESEYVSVSAFVYVLPQASPMEY
jgi:hypothetical protein